MSKPSASEQPTLTHGALPISDNATVAPTGTLPTSNPRPPGHRLLMVAMLFALFLAISGALLGAFVGAFVAGQLLVDKLREEGKLTDLLWIVGGGAVGAGLALLWSKIRKEKAKALEGQNHILHKLRVSVGGTVGAAVGAAVAVPSSAAAVLLPPAIACGVLFPIGFGLSTLTFMLVHRASLFPRLLGGGISGLLGGWTMWLMISAFATAEQAVPGDLGGAFRGMLMQMAADAVGVRALLFAVSGAIVWLLICWRLPAAKPQDESSQGKE